MISSAALAAAGNARPRSALRRHRRYLLVMAACAVVLGVPLLLNLVLLWRSGELLDVAAIARRQQAQDAIYSSALHSNDREHRLALVAARQPVVVAFGSSRMEQFRQDYFNVAFSCACTLMGAVEHGGPVIDAMFKLAKPRLVILGLDYWWFTDIPNDSAGRWRPSPNANRLDANKLLKPFDWLRRGSLGARRYTDLLLGRPAIDAPTTHPAIGVAAIVTGRGFRKDGSALHADALFGPPRHVKGQDFGLVQGQIAAGDAYYPHDAHTAAARFAALDRLVRAIEGFGAKVVIIIPPMAGRVVDMMKASGHFAYVDAIRARLRTRGGELYDFHDARPLGATDCEFLDDRHGGDVVVMRMLLSIVAENPRSALAPYVDRAKLTMAVERFKGRALAVFAPARYRRSETDFLGLGCVKPKLAGRV